ncbi:hypothetical protein N658DRAFT_505119 [Parathielavia hyrcaniae]|uniref:RGS domain-containing protein n=1 Tax=Parathielavia hyrcaniae TaxID=113614 RepID=A0AAN6Q4K3_9PEZI|nr:hypothetical protein N658DRAFT_505119 [Parathielavia hyrcaniae]
MMPGRSDTAGSLPSPRDDLAKMDSNPSTPVVVWRNPFDRQGSNALSTALAPPPGPKPLPKRKSNFRLRSDSGLALHTNQAAFRNYTEYNPDGSISTRPSRSRHPSFDDSSSVEEFIRGHHITAEPKGLVTNGKVLPDLFEPAVFKLALSNRETAQRFRAFAQTRGCGSDIDFLLKVEDYSRTLGDVISTMSYISSNFTGTTATSPLELPMEVASTLKANIKLSTRTAIPALDKTYQDAKAAVEARLAQGLYPEFVKYQLAQRLTASLSTHHSMTGELQSPYPGLGDAFNISDPLQPDNPIVFSSDGFLAMTGYHRREIIGKNCRLIQGLASDPEAVTRISRAISSGSDVTELILNYRRDGTPFWNLLFICPLMEHGSVRYFLGAQINISEHMEAGYKDVMDVLNFGPMSEDAYPARSPAAPSSPSWSPRPSSDYQRPEADEQDEKATSRRHRFFRRFNRKHAPSRTPDSSRRPSAASERSVDSSQRAHSPRWYPPLNFSFGRHHSHHHHEHDHLAHQHMVEHSTPYSRFLVMRYNYSNNNPRQHNNPESRPPTSTNGRRHLQPDRRPPRDHHRHRAPAPLLPITFCSPSALALLGLKPHDESHCVLDRDVFSVLASRLGSPNFNRGVFRGDVLGRLGRGEGVTVDLMAVPSSSSSAAAAAASITNSGGSGTTSEGDGSGSGGGRLPRVSGTLDRGAGFFSQVLFAGGQAGGGGSRLRRVVSTWVPLKDGEGRVAWVVLVLNPVEND